MVVVQYIFPLPGKRVVKGVPYHIQAVFRKTNSSKLNKYININIPDFAPNTARQIDRRSGKNQTKKCRACQNKKEQNTKLVAHKPIAIYQNHHVPADALLLQSGHSDHFALPCALPRYADSSRNRMRGTQQNATQCVEHAEEGLEIPLLRSQAEGTML